MKVLLTKRLGSLFPADDAAAEALRAIKPGEMVRAHIVRPRNSGHHRLFWALMTKVHANLPEPQAARYPTVETLVAAFKILTGVRTEIHLPGGMVGYIPGSISFAKMDQDAFNAFFDRAVGLVVEHFLPGVTDAELRREIEEMVGMRTAP